MMTTDAQAARLEEIAALVYVAMSFEQPKWVPWVPGGNSDAQEHARRVARRIAADPAEAPLRAAVETYLRDNDPEGFGCACTPTCICGPCRAAQRQAPLRAALGGAA